AHPRAWLSVVRGPRCGRTLHSLHARAGHGAAAPAPVLLADALRAPLPAARPVNMGQGLPLWDAPQVQPCRARQVLAADEYARVRHVAPILLDSSNASGRSEEHTSELQS